jgi:hypothetical protein
VIVFVGVVVIVRVGGLVVVIGIGVSFVGAVACGEGDFLGETGVIEEVDFLIGAELVRLTLRAFTGRFAFVFSFFAPDVRDILGEGAEGVSKAEFDL